VQRLWRLDRTRLKPGDVLLERSPTFKSAAIRGITRGSYSHALIWMGNSDFMEAVGDGVRPMPYVRVVTSDPSLWSLLRLESNQDAAAAAATFVRNHSFTRYNTLGALGSFLPTSGSTRAAKLFCSQLIATAYKSAGIDLCPGKEASRITPALLQKRSILREAHSPFVEIIDPNELRLFAQIQDRDEALKESSLDIERKVSQDAFAAVEKLSRKIEKPRDSRISYPSTNLGGLIELLAHETTPEGDACASKLLSELSSGNYFDLFTPVVAELSIYLHSRLAILNAGKHSAELNDAIISQLDEISSGWEDTQSRFKANYATCMAGYQRNRRELLLKLAAMYFKNAEAFDYLGNILQQCTAYTARSGRNTSS
jgi:hypothetical protein